MQEVRIYGTSWSVACWDIRRLLESLEEPHSFVDLEADSSALLWAMQVSDGDLASAIPIVQLRDGSLIKGATRQLVAQVYGIRLDTGMIRRSEPGQQSHEDSTRV